MFSVVRGYNIPIIILAQYLSAIFILAPEKRALAVLLDFNLFILVLASSLTIASGYIINSFYDSKKDLIIGSSRHLSIQVETANIQLSIASQLSINIQQKRFVEILKNIDTKQVE